MHGQPSIKKRICCFDCCFSHSDITWSFSTYYWYRSTLFYPRPIVFIKCCYIILTYTENRKNVSLSTMLFEKSIICVYKTVLSV